MTDLPDLRDIRRDLPQTFVHELRGRPADGGLDGDSWLASLPRLVRECAEQWSLRATAPVRHGACALVVPTVSSHGPAMLKVTWPHEEARHEHLALRAWDGAGAVRLLAADPHRWAMLLEPLHADRPLTAVDVDTCSHVIGGLLRRLDRPALAQLPRLSSEAERWAEQLRTYDPRLLPRRIVERAAALLIELGGAPGSDTRLVHADLHDTNVLAADREPWLAIDPKPLAAVPELGVAPLVWNRSDDARRAGSVRGHLRRRVEIACAAGELDVELAMQWTLVRCALNVAWAAERSDRAGSALVPWWVICTKAMQY